MRPRRFPSNEVAVRDVARGPHPVTVYEVGSVDVAWGLGMAGGLGMLRVGEPSDPMRRFTGEGGPQQAFRGGAFVGASRNLRPGFNTALPATSAPAAVPNAVVDLLGRMP